MQSLIALIVSVIMSIPNLFGYWMGGMPAHIRSDKPPSVFIGGSIAYGDNSNLAYLMPSFGFIDDVPRMLEEEGYEVYVTSPGTFNSNWDRACNAYGELTGTLVDYGEAHAREHGHSRYGRNYTKPLVEDWGPERPINLFGDSQGGQTVYLLASLLAEGDEAEREAAEEGSLSPLFEGGHSDLVHSVTAFGGPLNGANTQPYFIGSWIYYALIPFFAFDIDAFQYTGWDDLLAYAEGVDNCIYDLSPMGALEMNKKCRTNENIYYFSYTLCDSELDEEGNHVLPITNVTESLPFGAILWVFSYFPGYGKGAFEGMTFEYEGEYESGSFTVDETWRPNDGATSVAACKYPFGQPHKEFDAENIEPGVWQSFPTLYGYNHGFYSGFDFRHSTQEMFEFYLNHLRVLDTTY